MKILVCDDTPFDQQVAKAALLALGHEPIVVDTGEAALQVLRTDGAPRMLLLDWVLPSADGLAVCRRIREECHSSYVYTVLMTGKRAESDVTAAFEAGADDFIPKPFDRTALAARLRAGERILSLEERLREEAVMRERFIGILGHDLRQPLDSIVLGAELLARRGEGEDALRLERIARSGQRMNAMIRDLLDFARGRLGGGIPVRPACMDLRVTCQRAVDEVGVVFAERTFDLGSRGDTTGTWDGERLAEAITNLLNNACSYSPGDAPVRIFLDGSAASEVALEVSNGGQAIPPDLATRIFDPFRRGAHPHAPRAGLGLGLYIAREIARSHGGTLTLRSDAEWPTTFRLALPRESSNRH